MGQKDISLITYFEDQRRYADLINGFVFKGKQIVSEQDVQEMDSRAAGAFGKLQRRLMVQKYRDCVRRIIFDMGFVIMGLEHQDKVHHGMPVRIMVEDAVSYDQQMRQIKRDHRNRRDLRGDEFLRGFARIDKLYPVVTICIYYGEMPYDGAKELYHMMDYEKLPEEFRKLLNNYKIHVLEIRDFQDIDFFRTDLREVFGFVQRSGDPDAEKRFTFENEEQFRKMDEDAYDVIISMTGSTELAQVKEIYREEGGKINMCEAIRGMIERGRAAGVAEGRAEGMAEGQEKKAYTAAKNMYARGFSAEDTAGLLEESKDTVLNWFESWEKGR